MPGGRCVVSLWLFLLPLLHAPMTLEPTVCSRWEAHPKVSLCRDAEPYLVGSGKVVTLVKPSGEKVRVLVGFRLAKPKVWASR